MTRPTRRGERDGERLHRLGAAVLAATLALTAGCRTTEDVQRDYARTLRPADIEAPPAASAAAPATPVRTFRVRLYADAGYQRQTLRWREKLEAQVERANRVLERLFGARLVTESVRAWETGGGSANLAAALASLAAADPGADVDWVFGFVPAGESIALADPLLGMAVQFGRHVVLRAMNSREERDAMEASLDHLSADERAAVVRERLLHRETVVLLHDASRPSPAPTWSGPTAPGSAARSGSPPSLLRCQRTARQSTSRRSARRSGTLRWRSSTSRRSARHGSSGRSPAPRAPRS